MMTNPEPQTPHLQQVLKDTQDYLAELLAENDYLLQRVYSLEADNRGLREANLGLAARMVLLTERVANDSAPPYANVAHLDWSDQATHQ